MSRIFVEHDDSGILKPFDLEKHNKEIRAEVIDEYFEKLQSVAFGNRKGLVHFKDIVAIREQLKEQKNDR